MPRWICDQDRYALIIRDTESAGGVCTCAYCGAGVAVGAHNKNPLAAELDHKTPRSKGGEVLAPENLVVACHKCNHAKSDMDLAAWLAVGVSDRAASEERLRVREVLSAEWSRFVAASKAAGYKR